MQSLKQLITRHFSEAVIWFSVPQFCHQTHTHTEGNEPNQQNKSHSTLNSIRYEFNLRRNKERKTKTKWRKCVIQHSINFVLCIACEMRAVAHNVAAFSPYILWTCVRACMHALHIRYVSFLSVSPSLSSYIVVLPKCCCSFVGATYKLDLATLFFSFFPW